MSKFTRQNFVVVFTALFLFVPSVTHGQNAGGQTIEVVLSFGQIVREVVREDIVVNGQIPDRVSIDREGRLHLYLTSPEAVSDTVFLEVAPGAVVFEGGEANRAISQTVAVERRGAAQTPALVAALTIGETLSRGERFAKGIQPATSATLGGALVPLLLFNPSILQNLPYLPTYLYHFFSWFLSLLGLKKKRKPWGMVYNSITKEPLSLAIVRLLEHPSSRIIETQVTDQAGRFGFLPAPGTYRLEVVKPTFFFPSTIVKGTTDGTLSDIYHTDNIGLQEAERIVRFNIPLDPEDPRRAPKHVAAGTIRTINHFVSSAALGLLIAGTSVSYTMVFLLPLLVNYIILYLYLAFTSLQVVFQIREPRPWGDVFNAVSFKPVPLAVVSLVETKYDRIVKTRLADWEGRFHFLPAPGSYRLIVKAEGHTFPSRERLKTKKYPHPYFGEELTLKAGEAAVTVDVPVDPQGEAKV